MQQVEGCEICLGQVGGISWVDRAIGTGAVGLHNLQNELEVATNTSILIKFLGQAFDLEIDPAVATDRSVSQGLRYFSDEIEKLASSQEVR